MDRGRATLLPGVTVGENAIVAGGDVPARFIRNIRQ